MQTVAPRIDSFNVRARNSLYQNPDAAIGQFEHPHDHGHRTNPIEITLLRFFFVEILLAIEQDHALFAQCLVDGPDRSFTRHKQRHDHEGINHDVAQGQQRQFARDLHLLFGLQRFGNLFFDFCHIR